MRECLSPTFKPFKPSLFLVDKNILNAAISRVIKEMRDHVLKGPDKTYLQEVINDRIPLRCDQ